MNSPEQKQPLASDTPAPQLSSVEGSSLDRGFERLRIFVERFNSSCDPSQRLNSAEIEKDLRARDVVNDSILKALSASDIADITSVSAPVAKALQKEFSLADSTTQRRPERIPTRLTVQSLSLKELIRQYDPTQLASAVIAEFKLRVKREIGRNPKVIVFNPDESINQEATWRLLQDALQGDPDLDQIAVDGKSLYTFRIGERPNQVVEIHPITKEYLRSNGVGRDNLDWTSLPLENRQLLFLAVKSGELSSEPTRRDLVYYHQMAGSDDGLAALQAEFPEAAKDFYERSLVDNLPSQRRIRRQADISEDLIKSTKR